MVEGVEIKPKVQVMDEGLFFVADIHEGSVEVGEDLLHLSKVNVSNRKLVPNAGLG